MRQKEDDVLDLLKEELAFLEDASDKASARSSWKPSTVFLDSAACLNPNRLASSYSCHDCPLIQFVPPGRHEEDYPCHHVPLTPAGETLDSLYRWGTEEEPEQAFRIWLFETIGQMERGRILKRCA